MLEEKNNVKAMWLFLREPVWTAYNPPDDHFKPGGGGQYVEVLVQTAQWHSWNLAHLSFTLLNVLKAIPAENLFFILAFILLTWD